MSSSKEEGYDPRKSKVSEDRMALFKNGVITGDLLEVPGIGPAAVTKLAAEDIHNTYQLFGQYLLCKTQKLNDDTVICDPIEHNDKFWYWLKSAGVVAHRSAIVRALAERVAGWMPSLYDPSVYYEEQEQDEEQEKDE